LTGRKKALNPLTLLRRVRGETLTILYLKLFVLVRGKIFLFFDKTDDFVIYLEKGGLLMANIDIFS
jgi:hypothetical protein